MFHICQLIAVLKIHAYFTLRQIFNMSHQDQIIYILYQGTLLFIVFAFDGDSTITSDFAIYSLLPVPVSFLFHILSDQ